MMTDHYAGDVIPITVRTVLEDHNKPGKSGAGFGVHYQIYVARNTEGGRYGRVRDDKPSPVSDK